MADSYSADDLASGSQIDFVHDDRCVGAFSAVGCPNGNILVDVAVTTDFCLAITMIQPKCPI